MRQHDQPLSLGRSTCRDRSALLNALPKDAVCVEIGVWKGEFSQEILDVVHPRLLHLIDPWLFAPEFPKRWYGGKQAKNQSGMDTIYNRVVARLGNDPRVKIHRKRSIDAADAFRDGDLDWVYVDGDHSYNAVLKDLQSWKRKVGRGGIICGDDYAWRDEDNRPSVQCAVVEFAATERLTVEVLHGGQFLIRT